MSWNCDDTTEVVDGGWLSSAYSGLGITGAEIAALPSGESGESVLKNDTDPGDETKEFIARLVSLPTGTFEFFEDGSFIHTGGTTSFQYQLKVDGQNTGAPVTVVITYGDVSSVTSDVAQSFSILGLAQSDRAAGYAILGAAQSDLGAVYAVENAGTALSDLPVTYGIATTAQRNLAGSFGIASTAEADSEQQFDVLALVQVDSVHAYGIASAVSADLSGAYDVLALTSLASDLSAAWSIAGSVANDLSGTFRVFSGSGGGGADPAEVWAYVMPNGQTAEQMMLETHAYVMALARIHGLVIGEPLVVSQTARTAGPITQSLGQNPAGDVVVERLT